MFAWLKKLFCECRNVKMYDFVVVVHNETGQEWRGVVLECTPATVVIKDFETCKVKCFDAKKVHFKERW